MAFERNDGKKEDYSNTKLQPGGHTCWYNSYCFFSDCPEPPDTFWRETNYYEHMRVHHRAEFHLHGIATNATKDEDTAKIRAIVKAHCEERATNPRMMEWAWPEN